ncbi:glutamine amidotransferase family protein [Geomonas sp. RF6]|uniref:class II glutamine amidotransferase n=1 Tax=Geomonas sp. RF6 TaxID=2897342 RepID=UPI001E367688|nr:glutamine amidotransferase family protein [Geomonas sp. RF6]UFS69309.1 glutamine amidotransferase family protein [Geomonas sp. RF6]
MCRIGAIKSLNYVHPSRALQLMNSQQKGHDNSGFAVVMQDLGGVFKDYKEFPTISLACTDEGLKAAEAILDAIGFRQVFEWVPKTTRKPGMDIQALPNYVFRTFDYPENFKNASKREKEDLLTNTRLKIRTVMEPNEAGFVYSFWPDVVTLKEIGDPRDIGTFFGLWEADESFTAKVITTQCRQNTNYAIVRYAAHPFFLQGYTALANGENTFYQKNKEFQASLNPAYRGFESDSQCFLYTLHYMHRELGWPLNYYKHIITPLPFDEVQERPDRDQLFAIRQSLAHLEINGPNTIIGTLPDHTMFVCCDAKKLRPIVVGHTADTVVLSSEVCGINEILPERNWEQDIYPNEREIVVIGNNLEVQRWKQ